MKPKAIFKIIVDIGMTLGLLFLMGYQFWGDVAHEWVGAGMFFLFILHHLLNIGWYQGLFRGKYSPLRILHLVMNVLVFLAMLGLMVSGMMLSNHVFAFLELKGGLSFARLLHMAASYWGFVLMALHLGLHWRIFMKMTKKMRKQKKSSRAGRNLFLAVGVGIAVYGMTAFIRRNLLTYMLVKTQFVFLDFGEPIPLFYLDYLAMMGTFIFIAWSASKLLVKPNGEKAKGGSK